ncbi:MAG: hypothetical protein K5773_02240 [Pseudobutyrivibrio sp.]|nr:hypothetical protein [Pseudobutyrivibrio sp.]
MQKKKISNAKNTLILYIVLAACFLVLSIVCPIRYQNNDDKIIMYILAGFNSGHPEYGAAFGGIFWSWIIAGLYSITGHVAWYTVMTLFVIESSVFAVSYVICHLVPGIKAYVISILLLISTFAYFTSAMQYTVTAAMAGCAAICLLIYYLKNVKQGPFICSIIFLLLAFGIRKQIGILTLGGEIIILGIAFLNVLINAGKADKESVSQNIFQNKNLGFVLKTSAIILGAFIFSYGFNAIYEKAAGFDEYWDYYDSACYYLDYPHVDIDDDPTGVYESIGWDKELYTMANKWFFMDSRCTTENFETIKAAYTGGQTLTLGEYIARAMDILRSSKVANVQLIGWIIFLLIANIFTLVKKNFNHWIITADVMMLGFLAMMGYYCIFLGRFPLRVYQSAILIFLVPILVLLLAGEGSITISKVYICLSLIIFAFTYAKYPAGNMLKALNLVCHDPARDADIAAALKLDQYAIENPDNIYIFDYELSVPADPFITYPEGKPYNEFYWGGWTYKMPVYEHQLEANGIDSLDSSDFIDSNVYISGKYIDEDLTAYMQSRYGQVEPEIVEDLGDIIIYQYRKK